MLAACVAILVSMGLRQTFGLFFSAFEEGLNCTRTEFGLAIGIQMLFWGMFAPIFGLLADKFGGSKSVFIGFVIFGIGIYMLYSGPNTGIYFQISLGVLVGIALGATAMSVPVSEVGKHFSNEQRTIATGIVTAAASVGYFLAPLFTKYTLGTVGWEQTLKYFLYFILFGGIASLFIIPKKIEDVPIKYNFIIASQAFRLRSPYKRTMRIIIQPLLKMLESKGQFFLVYSSGNDFTKKMLKYFFPAIKPFQFNDPKEFIKEVKKDKINKNLFKISVSSFIYTFINMSLTSKKRFSPINSLGLWNAATYVGQISEKEQKAININTKFLDKVSEIGQKLPLRFKDYLLRFEKNRD